MQIQINSDHHIKVHEAFATQIRIVVENALIRVSEHITRIEVHLNDENGEKNSHNDKHCVMEARLEGHQPVAVTHNADVLDKAIDGAAEKLARLIESILGRREDQKNRRTDGT